MNSGAVARYVKYYVDYVLQNKDSWQALERELPQIRRAWDTVVAGESGEPGRPDAILSLIEGMGAFQSGRGLWREQAEWLKSGLISARAADLHGEKANLLTSLAAAFYATGEKAEARKVLHQVLAHAQTMEGKVPRASALSNLASLYSDEGNVDRAASLYHEALDLFHDARHRAGIAATLGNLGRLHADIGDYAQALALHERAGTIFRSLDDRPGEATSLANQAGVLRREGNSLPALIRYRDALLLMNTAGERAGRARTLNNMGLLQYEAGDLGPALEAFEEALSLCREIEDAAGEAVALNNLALVHRHTGDFRRAINYYRAALAVKKEIGDRAGQLAALSNIGETYAASGKPGYAWTYYRKALRLLRKGASGNTEAQNEALPGPRAQAALLNNIAQLQADEHDLEGAIASYMEALLLLDSGGLPGERAIVCYNIAGLYAALGPEMHGRALVFYRRALELLDKSNPLRSSILTDMRSLGDGPAIEEPEVTGTEL